MTSTTTTKVTIHNSLVLVRNVPKHRKGTEWYLCKKEHYDDIYEYLRYGLDSGRYTDKPHLFGGGFHTNEYPQMLVYVDRPWLHHYEVTSRYGRYCFTDMNTVKQFCNYVGTVSDDSENGDHFIDTENYLKTVFGPLSKY